MKKVNSTSEKTLVPMAVRKRVGFRLHRVLLYRGLLKHPYGRKFAREHYSLTGKERTLPAKTADDTIPGMLRTPVQSRRERSPAATESEPP